MSDAKFFTWLTQYYIDARYLSQFRIVYCLVVVLFAGFPAYTWIGSAPDYLFTPSPISIASLVSGFPTPEFFQVLTLICLSCFCLMALGLWTKVVSVIFSISCIVGHSFWYSFGKIDHTLLWFVMPLFMAPAGWGYYNSIDSYFKTRVTDPISKEAVLQNSFWIFLLALTIGFSMFTAGLQKIAGGWLNLDTSASRFHLIRNFYSKEKAKLVAQYFLNIESGYFWKLTDYMTIFLEVGLLFSVLSARVFRNFLVGAAIFHIMVLLILNIPFVSNLIVYIVFVNWKSLHWLNDLNDKLRQRQYLFRFLIVMGCFFVFTSVTWAGLAIYNTAYKILPSFTEAVLDWAGSADPHHTSILVFYGVYSVGILIVIFRYYVGRWHVKMSST